MKFPADSNVREDEEVRFLNFISGLVARNEVWAADGIHEDLRESASEGHWARHDGSLEGLSVRADGVVGIGLV